MSQHGGETWSWSHAGLVTHLNMQAPGVQVLATFSTLDTYIYGLSNWLWLTTYPSHGMILSQAIQDKIKEHLDQLKAKVPPRCTSVGRWHRWFSQGQIISRFIFWGEGFGRKNTQVQTRKGKETKMTASKTTMVIIEEEDRLNYITIWKKQYGKK